MSFDLGPLVLPTPRSQIDLNYVRDFIRVLEAWSRELVSRSSKETGEVAFSEVTADTTLGLNDGFVLVDATSSDVTVTLPDATTALGREFSVKRKDGSAYTVTIDTDGGNIDESASASIIVQYVALRFKSDGTDYWIF